MGKEFPFLDLSRLSWTPQKEEIHTARIFNEVNERQKEEEGRWQKIFDSDPPRQSREDFEAVAFRLGITQEELHQKIQTDPRHFQRVFDVATSSPNFQLSWEEAEKILARNLETGTKLLDKISRYHNSNQPKALYPREAKPPRIFEKRLKRRKQVTRVQLAERMKTWKRWKEASEAINNSDLDRYA